ncbi:hypothetical protein R1sor_023900 [Riccia sorocarpa]|uniref:Glutathione S-transferase 3, mitochondrial n=1 Tax=Riccia sorocarpa TaxID=122646 RepID=A0ABD3GUW2_9MARC
MAAMIVLAASNVGIPMGACSSIVGSPLRLPAHSAAPFLRRSFRPAVRAAAPVPLPPQYGYVILTAASSYVLTQWQAIQIGAQRRKYGIKYPKMYEDSEESVFNCYQRAHQNTLEAYPAFLAMLLTGGLAYPVTSAVLGLAWVIGRIIYTLGYYTGKPENRNKGTPFHFFALVGLLVTCIVFGVKQLRYLP